MILGRVVGNIVSTTKVSGLVGYKLLTVQHVEGGVAVKKYTVCVDVVGAGVGELVIVSTGSSARMALNQPSSPVDAAIVGIVDR